MFADLIDSVGDPYGAGKSPSGQFSYPAFTFPGPQGGQYAKASLYHHQLSLQEDQGIDMTQVRDNNMLLFSKATHL